MDQNNSEGHTKGEARQLRKLAFRVRALRSAAGFSQESFAYEIGVHPNYESGIERAERNIGFLNLCKVAHGLRISLSELLAFDDEAVIEKVRTDEVLRRRAERRRRRRK